MYMHSPARKCVAVSISLLFVGMDEYDVWICAQLHMRSLHPCILICLHESAFDKLKTDSITLSDLSIASRSSHRPASEQDSVIGRTCLRQIGNQICDQVCDLDSEMEFSQSSSQTSSQTSAWTSSRAGSLAGLRPASELDSEMEFGLY